MRSTRATFLGVVAIAVLAHAAVCHSSKAARAAAARVATRLPLSVEDWDRHAPYLRERLTEALAGQPAAPLSARLVERTRRGSFTIERVALSRADRQPIPALVLVPQGHVGRGPAVLFHHDLASAAGKDALLLPEGKGPRRPLGEELVRAGFIVMAIDIAGFGERRGRGLNATDASAAPSWSAILAEDRQALEYLCQRRDVDPDRIAAVGPGSGGARAILLAALDERVQVVVDWGGLAPLVESPHPHDAPATTPGSLTGTLAAAGLDGRAVAGLVAPRPWLALAGPPGEGLAPEATPDPLRELHGFQERLYGRYDLPELFRTESYPDRGEDPAPRIWRQALLWLVEEL